MNSPLSKSSDHSLYLAIKNGDRKAFRQLFNTYWKRLYTYAYKIYEDETICEDIVQEVFISLWEKDASVKIMNIEAYLFQSVKYKVANHIRDLKFTERHSTVLNQITTVNSEKNLEYREFENEVMHKIDLLPPKCRKIFKMSRFEQLSNSEIAESLGLSVRTVETQISNALKFLRSQIHVLQYFLLISFLLF